MAHKKTAPPDEISFHMDTLKTRDDIIIGCDANARHTIWGSKRGEYILDFINFNNITICNSDTKPAKRN